MGGSFLDILGVIRFGQLQLANIAFVSTPYDGKGKRMINVPVFHTWD